MRCLKNLYRIRLLDVPSVAIPELWAQILAEMASRQDSAGDQREQAWKTFRNAVLNQPKFVAFLVSNQELSKKLGECFSSLDDRVSSCMIRMLPALAIPLTTAGDQSDHQNLVDLWTKLTDPSVLIAGKIRSAFKASMNKATPSPLRRAIITFVNCLWDAPKTEWVDTGGAALQGFITAPHILSELTELLNEVARIFGRSRL
jgi:hypothetical protein